VLFWGSSPVSELTEYWFNFILLLHLKLHWQ